MATVEKTGKPPPSLVGEVTRLSMMKPVPMKLFAAWEVDRTPPNCIPRLCSLTLTRLLLLQPVGEDVASLTIAVKMQSSKRTLRSNEIIIPNNRLLDTELDLTFSLQYPHFIKRDGNKLQIMLQRRKRYKNRTILGFKTLAVGFINMSQVLQKSMDKELDLRSNVKEKNAIVAKVLMLSLSSQPVDHDEDSSYRLKSLRRSNQHTGDRTGDFSDEDEDFVSSNEEGSDSEPMLEDGSVSNHRTRSHHTHARQRSRKSNRSKIIPGRVSDRRDSVQQRNLKQKFIALLKRFKITDELQALDSEQDHEMDQELDGENRGGDDIDDLLDEFDDLSDSGPEMDTMSISSTPKPSLRPFFSTTTLTLPDKQSLDRMSDDSSKKTGDSDSHHETGTDPELSDPQVTGISSANNVDKKGGKLFLRDKDKKFASTNKDKESSVATNKDKTTLLERNSSSSHIESSPRKVVLEQLNKLFPTLDEQIPDHVAMVNTNETMCQIIVSRLTDWKSLRVIYTATSADIRATLSSLVSRLQKFCNTNAKPPSPIKIGIVGSESYVNTILRSYVDQFSSKPTDWQTYVKFLIIPVGGGSLAKYLGSIDSMYSTTFLDASWRDLCDRVSENRSYTDIQDVINRISLYINNASACLQLPIGEAMVTYREKCSTDESSQIFIPFLNDVRIGLTDSMLLNSVDIEDGQLSTTSTIHQPTSTITSSSVTMPGTLSGSPPSSVTSHITDKCTKESTTPPSSPNIGGPLGAPQFSMEKTSEALDLQIDYWLVQSKESTKESKKSAESGSKCSLKTTFRSLQVSHLPASGEHVSSTSHLLTLNYVTKEKKQKIIRLGKKKEKEKDIDVKPQVVEGINRLICSTKSQPSQLRVNIDGVEWHGVKFFQLSSQWQTHIKHFPIGLFSQRETGF